MVQGSGGEYFVSAGSDLKAIHRVFERLGSEADDSAFHANLLQLLRDHKREITMPVSRVTERVFYS
jgi:hypothetical protein